MNGGPKDSRGLTIKQGKFVKEYVATNGNGTRAAQRAGYSAHREPEDPATLKTLSVVAAENLEKPRIKSAIAKATRKALSADEVLHELTDVAKKRPVIKGSDKMKALELIGKYHKLFTDKVETSAPQDELKAQIIQDLGQKFGLTDHQAQAIVADVYGEGLDSEQVQ